MSFARPDDEITFFAETDFRNERRRFGIRRRDRRAHMYVIGRTGMGKSTLTPPWTRLVSSPTHVTWRTVGRASSLSFAIMAAGTGI